MPQGARDIQTNKSSCDAEPLQRLGWTEPRAVCLGRGRGHLMGSTMLQLGRIYSTARGSGVLHGRAERVEILLAMEAEDVGHLGHGEPFGGLQVSHQFVNRSLDDLNGPCGQMWSNARGERWS